jgi:hypothetical protein
MENSVKYEKFLARIANSELVAFLLRRKSYIITSHPKSGRTWLNVVIGKYFSLMFGVPENVFFTQHHFNIKMPKVSFTHLNSLEIVKTKDISILKNKNVILLIRDPRDIVVSYYYQITKRKKRLLFSGSMREFVRSDEYGISKIIAYMNLLSEAEHIANKFLLVTYESLHKNFIRQLGRILQFMSVPCDDKLMEKAVQHGEFSKMKKMEKNNKYKTSALAVRNPNDPNAYKVRSGKMGGYVEYFSQDDIKYMNQKINDELTAKFIFYK